MTVSGQPFDAARPDDELAQIERWIAQARKGSDEAMGKLVELGRGYLLQVANAELPAAVQGKLGASDVVQESMIQAQSDFSQFRGENEEEFLSWLRGILLNDLHDAHRRFQTHKRDVGREVSLAGDSHLGKPPLDPIAQDATPGTQAVGREETEAIRNAMSRLPDDYRLVLELRNWQLLSFEEIGRQLNRTAEAARKLWSRAVERLHQEWETPDDES